MQVTVKEAKFLKEGSNQKGPWKLYKIATTEGKEYTTFDTKADGLPPGSVIEMGVIVTKADGRMSVKGITIISQAAGSTAPSGTRYKSEPPDVRASIEAQTAFNGIVTLAAADKLEMDSAPVVGAIAWAKMKMSIKPEHTTSKSSEAATGSNLVDGTFANVGLLLTWCADNGVDRPTFLKIVGIAEGDISKVNIENAHQLVKDYLKNKPDQEGDVPF